MPEARFHIRRFDPERDAPGTVRYDDFVVPYESSLTVLEGLFYIQEHLDGSLSFRYCCRAAVCGSCAMYIDVTCTATSSRSSRCRTCRW